MSNSSSSSFILPKESGLLTSNVAAQVFETMIAAYNEWDREDSWERAHEMTCSKISAFFSANKMYDGNILIPWTTNYETWIFRNSDGKICVDTCNNIDWSRMCFETETNVQWLEEGHEISRYNFVPVYREFLDFEDMIQKRKSVYDAHRWSSLGYTTALGENWKDYDEED